MVDFFLLFSGLGVGSFINCVVYRLNYGLSPLFGRSFCPKCKHQLAWYDNIPLLSFVLLKGKCRYCQKLISLQYPLVELATGIMTVSIYNFSAKGGPASGWQFTIYNLLIAYALIALFVSDLRYQTIPDQIVCSAIVVSLLRSLVIGIWSLVIPGLLAGLFFLILVLITKGRGMGMGDVKLASLMGLILGWPKILVALYLAFLTGAAVGVILILLRKKHFGEHIPFGPFLVAGTFTALFWGEKIWQQISAALL